MKASIILILVSVICVSCTSYKQKMELRDPARPYANIELEGQPLVWSEVYEIIRALAVAGYVDIDLNGLKLHDHCIIPSQSGHDELVMTDASFSKGQIEQWCQRNKDKYAEVSFGGQVNFQTVKRICVLLDKHSVKYTILQKFEDVPNGIRIDIDRP